MKISIKGALIAAIGICVLGSVGQAATVAPILFQDLHWRSIGPFRGGRVLAVAGVPGHPHRFYFGAVNGGVWETDDAGRTWTPIADTIPVGSIGAIAVAPSAPDTLYVGTGEADMRSDIAQGIGMFKSTDGGAHWQSIGLSDTQQIGKILVDPRNPDVLLVAALGHPYGPNDQRGVFRSTDGGKNWTKTLFKNADTGAIDLSFQPGNPDVVYAALWQTRRPPWNVYPPSNGPGSGLYKSIDGGRTWTAITGHGLPAAPGRIGIATSEAAPNRIYALIDAVDGGLYRSDDAGATWRKMTGDSRIWQRGWYFGGITADPKNADRVWVCNTILLKSDNGGANFLPQKGDPTGDDFHSLWIDPNNPDRRILGVDQGALVTLNGGKSWSSWYNQPTGQFYHVSTDNRFPYHVYGAQQDSGAADVPSRTDSHFDGISMMQFHESAAGGESDEIAPDPDDPNIVFGGRVDKLDLKSGQLRDVDPTLAFPAGYRGTWTLPLTFGKHGGHRLFFGNQRIFRTVDGGQHWLPISPDLTRKTLTVPATLDPATAIDTSIKGPRRGVVYDIGPSPIQTGQIWAGTDDGLIWRTIDGGTHWQNVTPAALMPWSKVGTIEPSHFDPLVAYAAIDRHRLDDFAPYLYRTRDGGRTWTLITEGLGDGGAVDSVNVVREDPVQPGLLYGGTERGAFVSFDFGDHWQPLQRDLPITSVRDITIHGDDLVIATHGRGFYIMDDITPLRQLAAGIGAGPHLFAPAPAIRIHSPQFTGTPMPKDEPMATNPPFGASIDYALTSPPHTPVEIRILDARGAMVRSFSSADHPPALDLSRISAAPIWLQSPQSPSATPGEHRFIWDLHYATLKGLGGEESGTAGVWAPPGRYTVELSVDGLTFRQPLNVQPDPRVHVTPAAFQAEFALATQIEKARLRVKDALADAAVLKTHLAALLVTAPTANREALRTRISEIDQLTDLPIADARNSMEPAPGPLGGLHDIDIRLAKLADAVDGADGAPTSDDISGFHQVSQSLDMSIARLAKIKRSSG